MPDYIISSSELEALRHDASISSAIKELADVLSGRSQDVPHRFRAPAALANYIADYGVNQSVYHQLPLSYNVAAPIVLQITTRPTQGILELVFIGPEGLRLFTLEIEYDAVQKEGQ